MQSSVIPTFYRQPLGLPLRWLDEQSGILPAAVTSYFEHALDEKKPFTETQLNLVIQYCRYYINAPCWIDTAVRNGSEDVVASMRSLIVKAVQLQTAKDIDGWIRECLDIGIDPL